MQKVKKILSVLLILCLVFAMAACGGGSDDPAAEGRTTITLTIGGGHPSNTMSYTKVAYDYFQTEISKRAAAETNYDIEWIDAYGGTIAGLDEALTATQNGLLDVFVSSFAFETKKLLLMNMPYYVPFGTQDAVIANGAVRKVIDQFPEVYDELWATYNQKLLALGPTGSYELISIFPVEKVEDLKGHKIAGASSIMDWLNGQGITPVQATFNEVYTSLQTGVYEGDVAWADAAMRYKWDEVAKYCTKVGFGALAIQGISINLDKWENLPEEVQTIFLEVAAEYEEKAAVAANEWDVAAFEQMTNNNGMTVIELSDEERSKWVNQLDNLPKKWIAAATEAGLPGQELMEAYIAAQEELGHEFLRDWLNE